jgi:hypothetical protein
MFEGYTESARRVLFFARYEASQRGSLAVATEHLLLGLIRERTGVVSRILRDAHLSREHVLERIDYGRVVPEVIVASNPPDIPFDGESKGIIQRAAEEADRLLHNGVGTEHLLLGMLREERSVAASLLLEHGLRLRTVRDYIVLIQYEATAFPPSRTDKPNLPPSYDVHISPTTTEEEGTRGGAAPVNWMRLGCELKPIIAEVFHHARDAIDGCVRGDGAERRQRGQIAGAWWRRRHDQCSRVSGGHADSAPSGDQRIGAKRVREGGMRCLRVGHDDRRLL